MTARLLASSAVVFVVASVLAPPDLISQLMLGVGTSLICAVPLWFLAQCRFVKVSSPAVHTLICILVSLVAVLSAHCYQLRIGNRTRQQRTEEPWSQLDAAKAPADSNVPSDPPVDSP